MKKLGLNSRTPNLSVTRRVTAIVTIYGVLTAALTACGARRANSDAESEQRSTATSPGGDGTNSPSRRGGPGDLGSAPPTAEVGTLDGSLIVDGAGHSTYAISFEVAPGPRDLQPSVGIAYNSGAGNGLVGVGFGVTGLSMISRCSKTLADDNFKLEPLSFGETDALCLDQQRLLPVRDGIPVPAVNGKDGAEYRPRVGDRLRVFGHGSIAENDSWFEVQLPDGNIAAYGSVDESRVYQHSPSTDPATGGRAVREWWLRSVRDPYGHEVRHRYLFDDRGGTRVNMRPRSIEYGFVSDRPTRHVDFGYERRPDRIAGFVRGAPTAMEWRLVQVKVFGPDAPVRKYRLTYWEGNARSITERSLLRSAQECTPETDLDQERCKPASWFHWERGSDGYTPGDATSFASDAFPLNSVTTPDGRDGAETYAVLDPWTMVVAPRPIVEENGQVDARTWQEWGSGRGVNPGWAAKTTIDVARTLDTPRRVKGKLVPEDENSQQSERQFFYPQGAHIPSFVVNGDNDRFPDMIEVARNSDKVSWLDAWGPFLGHELWYMPGSPYSQQRFGDRVKLALDDSPNPILQLAPLDMNGDTISDYLYCRAHSMPAPEPTVQTCLDGYVTHYAQDDSEEPLCGQNIAPPLPGGSWYLVIGTPAGPSDDAILVDTGEDCNVDDQLAVLDTDGDGRQELLVVAARPEPAAWGNYQAMRLDPVTGQFLGWDDTGLPPDRFQRFMMGLMADTEDGSGWSDIHSALLRPNAQLYQQTYVRIDHHDETRVPFRAGGFGLDRYGDVNGDGLVDVIRLELGHREQASEEFHYGDDLTNLPHIRYATGNDAVMTYGYDDLGAFVWLNTGAGFVKQEQGLREFNAQELYEAGQIAGAFLQQATHWQSSLVLDHNADGLADLVMSDDLQVGTWGTYPWRIFDKLATSPESSTASVDVFSSSYLPPRPGPIMDLNLDGLPDLMSLQTSYGVDGETWRPMIHDGAVPDLLTRVRNGMGVHDYVEYAPVHRVDTPDSCSFDDEHDMFPKACVPAAQLRPVVSRVEADTSSPIVTLNDPWPGTRVTTYRYGEPRFDRLGRGWLGFGRLEVEERYPAQQIHNTVITRLMEPTWDDAVRDYPNRGFTWHSVARQNVQGTNNGADEVAKAHITTTHHVPGRVDHGGGRFTPYATIDEAQQYELVAAPGSACGEGEPCDIDDLAGKTPVRFSIHAITAVDSHGHPTQTITQDNRGSVTVTRELENREGALWQLGLVRNELVAETLIDGTTATREVATEYYGHAPVAYRRIREPNSVDPAIYLATTFLYDFHGRPISAASRNLTNSEIRFATTGWDDEGVFPLSRANMLGHRTDYLVWDRGRGIPTQVRSPDGVLSARQIDLFGRTIASQDFVDGAPSGPKTTTSYAMIANPDDAKSIWYVHTTSTTEGAGTSESFSDPLGRAVFDRTQNMLGQWTAAAVRYGQFGELTHRWLPQVTDEVPSASLAFTFNGPVERREYDQRQRLRKVTSADGLIQETRYGALATWSRDASGNWSRAVSSPGGQLERTLQGMPSPTHAPDAGADLSELCFGYTSFDQLAHTEPCALGDLEPNQPWNGPHATVMTYDILGRRLSLDDEKLGPRSYTYDSFGDLLTRTDANLVTTTYGSDVLGRPEWRLSPEGLARWTWDTLKPGALTSATGETGNSEHLTYDAMGRLSTVTSRVHGEDFTFGYAYDSYGQLDVLTYPTSPNADPLRVQYDYSPYGFLTEVKNLDTQLPYWTLDETDAAMRPTRVRFGNDLVTETTIDPLSGRVEEVVTKVETAPAIQWLKYEWSPNGSLAARRDLVHFQSETLTYDSRNRLTSSTIATPQAPGGIAAEFSYDPWGNLTHKDGVGAYAYSDNQRLHLAGGVGFSYDDNGNAETRTHDGDTTFLAYTSWNKPHTIWSDSDEDLLHFDYDAQYRRVWRSSSKTGLETVSLGLFERDSTGLAQTSKYSIRANDVVAQVIRTESPNVPISETVKYVHPDHLGSTDVVSGDADNGVIPVDRSSFDAWGARRDPANWLASLDDENASGVTPGFTGHRDRLDADLVDMGGRHYDPVVGRFMQPDPFVQAPANMASHNRYSYVFNNPLSLTDPSGFFADGEGSSGPGFSLPGLLGLAIMGIWALANSGNASAASGSPSANAGAKAAAQDAPVAPASPRPMQAASITGISRQETGRVKSNGLREFETCDRGHCHNEWRMVNGHLDFTQETGNGGKAAAEWAAMSAPLLLGGALVVTSTWATSAFSGVSNFVRGRTIVAHVPRLTAGQAAIADKVAVTTVLVGGGYGITFGGQVAGGAGSCETEAMLYMDTFGVGKAVRGSFHAFGRFANGLVFDNTYAANMKALYTKLGTDVPRWLAAIEPYDTFSAELYRDLQGRMDWLLDQANALDALRGAEQLPTTNGMDPDFL